MPDADIDRSGRRFVTPPTVCGLIGLTLGLLWGLWPASFDPLSMGLVRTVLCNRHLTTSPIRPVVIDLAPLAKPDPRIADEGSAPPWQFLLERIIQEEPRIIAFADVHHRFAPIAADLDIVPPDRQFKTLFISAADSGPSFSYDPQKMPARQRIGLRSASGHLGFNLHPVGSLYPEAAAMGPARPGTTAYCYGGGAVTSFALAVASAYLNIRGGDVAAVPDDYGRRSSPAAPTHRRDQRLAIQGGHRHFFDDYSATAVLEGRLPRGVLHDRIILLGMRPGTPPPVAAAALPPTTPLEANAFSVWALVNKQIVSRTPWLLAIELGLVLLMTILPTVFRWRLALKGMWIANGVLALALIAGSILFWHASGVMPQVGAAVLSLMLAGVVTTALPATRPANHFRAPSGKTLPLGRNRPSSFAGNQGPVDENTRKAHTLSTVAVTANAPLPPSGGQPSTKAPSARRIDRYEILRCIGRGAMGEVFLGRDPHINRLTAIKTLRFEENFAEDEIADIREKFFREAESAGTLSHANIVTIYDAGEERDLAYIAMEYLEGITLLRFTRPKRLLPLRKIIAYAVQIAEALDYAHRQGIVHRDIKPANIIVLKNGDVKITDFGIARITTSSHTQTGVVKGTPYYMSPEQFSGAKVDGRSDIFSLGTMLFQLLTGTLPFFSESPAVLMNQIMNFPHPNPQAINPRVMPAIIPIVDQALEKNRDRRYQNAGRMAADLVKLDRRIESYLEKKSRTTPRP